ncbi:4-amino-4-deoxychorismate lyase [Pseudarcicella hirudinis]|uniref:4-amino-4-deoxychorismate lyase n=1 Tax=Pseudarcicella hirudinis TaxID=1079859 RepID=A0A1I5RD15_9BACT|nr:aminotransferase class IV [Pseudarcicella hirudinis]SFP56448.1 4-amino-4-deoxychorismate lyase [Pseudarcicella hirudinis]
MKLLETIQVSDGKMLNIAYHSARFNRAREELFEVITEIHLEKIIGIPSQFKQGLFRCRVIYDERIEEVSFTPYQYKDVKKLKVVEAPHISYHYKWADRKEFSDLLTLHPEADEILIAQNGLLTDCTIANLAFWNGKSWITPSSPLLKGTRRQQLLDQKLITENEIKISDLKKYKKVCLINTFRELDPENSIDCKGIIY